MKGLAAAGHNITVISPFKQPTTTDNYREIVIDGILEELSSNYTNIINTLRKYQRN